MDTPILSAKQLKSTLSAKKQRPKETIKNVLAFPYNNNYWPEISPEDQKEVKDLVTKYMPIVRNNQIKVPWKELKVIPRDCRKSFRKEYNERLLGPLPLKQCCSGITFGINSMSKLLEKNCAQAVLLDAETMPRLLVQHIIDQAVLYKVPILCINNLKETLKSKTGINSVGVAFSKDISSDHPVNSIIEKVSCIFRTLPSPEDHINYNRSLEPFVQVHAKEMDTPMKEIVKVDVVQIRKEVYLMRTDLKSRVFVPKLEKPGIGKAKPTNKMEVDDTALDSDPQSFILTFEEPEMDEVKPTKQMEVDNTGFIAFTDEPPEKNIKDKPKHTVKVKYKPLLVKRLKSDPNRNKKKIQNMKVKKLKK